MTSITELLVANKCPLPWSYDREHDSIDDAESSPVFFNCVTTRKVVPLALAAVNHVDTLAAALWEYIEADQRAIRYAASMLGVDEGNGPGGFARDMEREIIYQFLWDEMRAARTPAPATEAS